MKTYKRCIENINERLKLNLNSISQEAKEISILPKIKSDQIIKLIEFIDKIRNFNFLAEAYDDLSYINNKMFINEIAEKLPNFLKNKWIDKQFDVESHNFSVKLCHMVEVLDKELPKLELRLRNDKLKFDSDHNSNKSINHGERFNNTNTDSEVEDEIKHEKRIKFDSLYCWFHRNNSHPSNKCKELWKLDGKSVSQLAKESNRCTYCGQRQHSPCPFNKNMKCSVEDCHMKHHALYCYRRKAYGKIGDNNSYSTNNTNQSQNEKFDESSSKCLKSPTKNRESIEHDSDSEAENEALRERFNNLKSIGLFTDNFAEYSRLQEIIKPSASNIHSVVPYNVVKSNFCLENQKFLPSKAIDILDESINTQMKINIQRSEVSHHLHNSLCEEFETQEKKILRNC